MTLKAKAITAFQQNGSENIKYLTSLQKLFTKLKTHSPKLFAPNNTEEDTLSLR